MQAAIGIEQMKKLDEILDRRRARASRYNLAFAEHAWIRPQEVPDYAETNYQSYAIRLSPDAPIARNELMQQMLDQGIATRRGVMLTHTETPYQQHVHCQLPKSESASNHSMLLPMYPELTENDQDRVIQALHDV